LVSIYKGTLPFISMDIIRLIILCAFPALSLWLPGILT
jgi:C4-dicarboxylate transporter, DctM subunit